MHIGTDSRLFERIDGELAVRYSPQGSDGEFCTNTRNISGGGMRISLLKKLDLGTMLDIEIFKYNTELKTRCRGKVIWMWNEPMDTEAEQHFEAGVEFVNSQLIYVGRLMEYLQKQK